MALPSYHAKSCWLYSSLQEQRHVRALALSARMRDSNVEVGITYHCDAQTPDICSPIVPLLQNDFWRHPAWLIMSPSLRVEAGRTVPTKLFRFPLSSASTDDLAIAGVVTAMLDLNWKWSTPGRACSTGVKGSFISPPTPKSARRIVPSASASRFPALRSRYGSAKADTSCAACTYVYEPPCVQVRQPL